MRYLIKQLKAEKFAYLYSPHFPYFVLVNKKGENSPATWRILLRKKSHWTKRHNTFYR